MMMGHLLSLHVLCDAYVGQQLSLQDLPRILDARSLGHPHGGPTLADEIQGHLHWQGMSRIGLPDPDSFAGEW